MQPTVFRFPTCTFPQPHRGMAFMNPPCYTTGSQRGKWTSASEMKEGEQSAEQSGSQALSPRASLVQFFLVPGLRVHRPGASCLPPTFTSSPPSALGKEWNSRLSPRCTGNSSLPWTRVPRNYARVALTIPPQCIEGGHQRHTDGLCWGPGPPGLRLLSSTHRL